MRLTWAGLAMPVVSQIVRPRTPRPAKRSAHSSSSASGTSPSMGQPKAQDKDTLMGVRPSTLRITSPSAAQLRARGMRKLARLCVSDTDITRFSSSARDSSARSAPRRLGTSTVYSTPGTR